METHLLHEKIEDLRNVTKARSHETDKLICRLREEGIEILNSQLNRQTLIVWIWCHSQAALENCQRLYESNQLRDVFFESIQPSTSNTINIDRYQFKKTVVVCPIFINFTQRIAIPENEVVYGVTKLRSEICVLCRSFSDALSVIRVFEDLSPFRLLKKIEIKEIKSPWDIGSSDKKNCLYVSDAYNNILWKIARETADEYKISKRLTIVCQPFNLSVSSDGQLLMVSKSSSILMIYGSDAENFRSIPLPRDIKAPIHTVETSIGNFIILHSWVEEEKGENRSSWGERVIKWGISELTRDGQMVIRRFTTSCETQQLNNPSYISLDSDDRVFVVDNGNKRVILLDSDLRWNRIVCPTKQEKEQKRIRLPIRLCYDEEKKQLIVGKYFKNGVNVYTLSRN